jgi:hypothetical protein
MNTNTPTERPYVAFHKNRKCEVTAASSFEAQKKAAELLKVKARHEVHVYLSDTPINTRDI